MLNDYSMNTVNSLITLILLLVAVFSVATSSLFFLFASASTEDDGWIEGDYEGSLEEQEEQAQEDWEDAGRPGEDENEGDNDNEIPNCDFDEFVNDDDECEKIPEDPVTAALPPCDGSLQNCVTPEGNVCLAGASTHECELPNPGDEEVSPGIPFPSTDDGDENNDGILNRYQDEDYEPNPYCDVVDYSVTCHDRKDYDQETGLYPCNDGTQKTDWRDCKDATEKDENKDEDGESPQSTTAQLAITEPDPNRFSPIGGGVYFPTESVPSPDRLKFGPFGILLPNQADEEFGLSATTSTSAVEESSCKILGSADGILQKYDTAKYQACGLYTNGQKAYSDGFVAGCIQVGNTQLICQSLVDSSKLNVNMLATPTQAVTQPTQGIQPAAVNK